MNTGEKHAAEFLSVRGFRTERFTRKEIAQSKTPEFRVYRGKEFVFYSESKHVQHDEWLDK